MHRYCIVSAILLILPIIDFAIAAPVLVQGKRQADVDVVHIPEDAIMLGKRGDELEELIQVFENHFAKPEESSAARPSSAMADDDYELVGAHAPPNPEPSTMSDGDYELVEALAPPNPGPSTVPDSDHADLMGAHAPQPDLGPSNPGPSTEFDSDHRLAVEKPPSRPAPPAEFGADQQNQVHHPPPPGSLPKEFDDDMYIPDRRSMGADSRLENIQAVSDAALKGNAKESRVFSGSARDVLNMAQRELQRERSLDHGE